MIKKIAVSLGIVQVFIAVGAIPAGLSMIFQPDGSGIGISTDILLDSPFSDFLVPGLFLLLVNGLCNAIGAFFSFRRNNYAGLIGLSLGIIMILWICTQVYLVGLIHFLQPLFFVVGLGELILGYFFNTKIKSTKVL